MSATESGEGFREKISSRGEEALGDLAQALLENPLFSQALQAAFGAREAAGQAGAQALRNLNVATVTDLERLARRLRAVADRLDEIEDRLDKLSSPGADDAVAAAAPSKPSD